VDIDIINAWKTLYAVSLKTNQSAHQARNSQVLGASPSSFFPLPKDFSPLFNMNVTHVKYLFILSLSAGILLVINFCICIIISRRGRGCRKREYNCLNNHKQLNLLSGSEQQQHQQQQQQQEHGGSSPSSTNSNGTITIDSTQQLIVNTSSHDHDHHPSPLSSLLCTTTNSSVHSTPPIDILHPINITKKNGILKCSTLKKTHVLIPASLPEAIV
jgi:hypothetical protein